MFYNIILNIALVPAYRNALYFIVEDRNKQRSMNIDGERINKKTMVIILPKFVEDTNRLGCGHYLLKVRSNCTRPGLLDLFDLSSVALPIPD